MPYDLNVSVVVERLTPKHTPPLGHSFCSVSASLRRSWRSYSVAVSLFSVCGEDGLSLSQNQTGLVRVQTRLCGIDEPTAICVNQFLRQVDEDSNR